MKNIFTLQGKVAMVTGGYGVLGMEMVRILAEYGAKVAVLGRSEAKGSAFVSELKDQGYEALFLQADVLDFASLASAKSELVEKYGKLDILVNAAGGNMPGATISPEQTIFDLNHNDFKKVVDLNLFGTTLPVQVFGSLLAEAKQASIINISSMAAQRAITRVVGYSAAKAAIDSYTRWLAVEMATKFGDGIRVNAIAPGFFLTEQNRSLLTHSDGTYTKRAQTIIANTPFGRFGRPEELNGALIWLSSHASSFVTGTVIPVDGGFSAFSGV